MATGRGAHKTADGGRVLVRGDYVWTGAELLHDAAVFCADGVIAEVGPWNELGAAHRDVAVVGGSGRIVLPGLINAHHHGDGITSFARGVLDDNLEPWLAGLGGAPSIDPYADTLLAALDTLQGGYTTMVLFQSPGDPAATFADAVARIDACRAVGLRTAFGLSLNQRNFYVYGPDPEGFPTRSGLSTKEYIDTLDALRERYASDPLVRVFAAPSGPEWVTDELWSAAGEWSKRHRLPLHTHALESPLQAEYARREYEEGLVARLDRLGALHEYTSLVHGVYLNEGDFDRMADRGASLITNPGSNLRLRCGVSPVLLALERGVNVALGTDGCSLGDRDDAFAELRLLFYLQREAGIDTRVLTWKQAVTMSTTAAARVTPWHDVPIGGDAANGDLDAATIPKRDATIGAIIPGMQADLSVYNVDAAAGPWSHPDLHPIHVLLHRATRGDVEALVIEGELVWEKESGSKLVDEQEAGERAAEAMARAAKRAASEKENAPSLPDVVTDYYRQW